MAYSMGTLALPPASSRDRRFLTGLARAFGGAIVFSLPILMTGEMWELGFHIDRLRLALLLVLLIPLLVGLSHFIGFEDTFGWQDDLVDAFVAYAVGFIAAAPVLMLLGVIDRSMPMDEIIGKLSLQAVPASIGALLAQSQFGAGGERARRKSERRDTYASEMFFMAAGAIFLSFNVAPTEEMIIIAYRMTPWHALGLCVLSIMLMHAFVYGLEFSGKSDIPPDTPAWSVFIRYTIVGYTICLLISAYILWTFGRISGYTVDEIVMTTVVLAFPAGIGAAAARLIL
ncbi:MAG TPA: TIGR02587 family membrane protein [Burkholderiales bacterium]|nr:TIGR02587 family membrane protein [Burkholderiales bacterium]